MNRNRIYGTVLLACLVGILWIGYSLWISPSSQGPSADVCLFKKATGIPCPSCGTTRSIMALFEGNVKDAIQWNPFGIIVICIMLISPFWIMIDFLKKENSFLVFYGRIEKIFRSKWMAIPAIGIVIANWVWNIVKGL